MRKVMVTMLAALLVLGGMSAAFAFGKKAESIALVPAMKSESAATNRIWVGTFQLAWNDLMDGIVKGPVVFKGSKSRTAKLLNQKSFTKDDISEDAYYTTYGEISPDLKTKIEKAIMEKFNETSDVLNAVDWTPAPEKYLVYAMLKKDFKFLTAFDKLKPAKFGSNRTKVEYFGIDKNSEKILRETVHVMFYNSSKDFAVAINTQGADVVYLYRTDDDENFEKLYSDMFIKRAEFNGNSDFTEKDELKVPNINLYKEQSFNELCGREIKGTKFMIDQALETVDFKMDNEGVKLKSEAVIATRMSALLPPQKVKPRKFYFDDTYVIFLQETGKDKPYFAMRVNDVETINMTGKK